MKKFMILVIFLINGSALASNADDLISAKAAFRNALNEQTNTDSKIKDLNNSLKMAQDQLMQAEANVAKYKSELESVNAKKQQSDAALEAASQRLNAAWEATRIK